MRRLAVLSGLAAALGLAGAGALATGLVTPDRVSALLPREAAGTTAPSPVAPADTPQPVRVTPVALVPLAVAATYTGTVRPRWEAAMGFRVAGELLGREVEVGDRVLAGDVLARLDPTDLDLARDAAEAEVAAAREGLSEAAAEAARSRALLADGHVPEARTDGAVAAEAEARRRLDQALAGLDVAANQAAYATLRADFAGVVTSAAAEPGQVVAAGQTVVTIARTEALDAVVPLPEHLLGSLAEATATAVLWGEEAAPPRPLTLREVAPDVDPVGRTYAVRLAFDDPDGVALGRTVTVTLTSPDAGRAAPLPLASIVNVGDGPAVWRVRGERAERVPVTVARLTPTEAWVTAPLAPGDLVVALGAHKLDPARPVRVVETVPPPA